MRAWESVRAKQREGLGNGWCLEKKWFKLKIFVTGRARVEMRETCLLQLFLSYLAQLKCSHGCVLQEIGLIKIHHTRHCDSARLHRSGSRAANSKLMSTILR